MLLKRAKWLHGILSEVHLSDKYTEMVIDGIFRCMVSERRLEYY